MRIMRKRWTADEDEFLRAEYWRSAAAELAERLGRTEAAIILRANRLGLSRRYNTHDLQRMIAKLHRDGLPDADIAASVGRCTSTVRGWRRRLGLLNYQRPVEQTAAADIDRLFAELAAERYFSGRPVNAKPI